MQSVGLRFVLLRRMISYGRD